MKKNKLGLVGHPLGHSLSPLMHRAVFEKLRLDYSYESFDVKPSELAYFMDITVYKGFVGLNVTIPYKVDILKYVDKVSREAELIGAVNTIKFVGDDVCGYNTDGIGCIKALKDAGVSVKDKRVLVLGAGGAARAVAFQCAIEGASLSIANRTMEKTKKLAADIEGRLGGKVCVCDFSYDGLLSGLKGIDVLINATSAGMHPHEDEELLSADMIPEKIAVMDLVYNPLETKLLSAARSRGCKTIDGVGMLARQGAESLNIWLGIDAPVKIMEDAVLSQLKKK